MNLINVDKINKLNQKEVIIIFVKLIKLSNVIYNYYSNLPDKKYISYSCGYDRTIFLS